MNSVLIIDDDKELCTLMKKCVEQENLSAVVAHGGLEGLRLLAENKDNCSHTCKHRVVCCNQKVCTPSTRYTGECSSETCNRMTAKCHKQNRTERNQYDVTGGRCDV